MSSRTKTICAASVVVLAAVIAYANGMQGVFVYDDLINIVNNPSIQRWNTAIAGTSRPLTNLSFWLHYRLGLTHAVFFHLVNISLHALNALLLWRILWHVSRHIDAGRRRLLSTAAALIWAVHPIHSESVTYIVQRAEVLSATFVLGGLLIGIDCMRERKRACVASMLACFVLAYLSKPTAVIAPFLFLLLDAAISGSLGRACRENRTVHLLGFGTLLVPLLLLTRSHESSTSAGFGMSIIGFWDYLLFQPRALFMYVGKLIWPSPLLIDYGYDLERGLAPLFFLSLVGLGIAPVILASRRGGLTRLGGLWFIVCLLPVVFVPLADLYAEHRLYLASAGVSVIFGCLALAACRRWIRSERWQSRSFLVVVAVTVTLFANRAIQRNRDYRDGLILWSQVVEHRPMNVRGHLGVGAALALRGDLTGAENSCRIAISTYKGLQSEFLRRSFQTDYAYACRNLAVILQGRGEAEAAGVLFEEAAKNAAVLR